MVTHAQIADPPPPAWARQDAFEYRSPPRAGLNWPFAQAMTLSAVLWSSIAISVTFWGCLFAARFL
jgi:hypothetical protein